MVHPALMRLGGLAAIASALLAFLSFVLYLVIVGGGRLSEAATSTTFCFRRGIVLYTGKTAVPFGENLHALPVSSLWNTTA